MTSHTVDRTGLLCGQYCLYRLLQARGINCSLPMVCSHTIQGATAAIIDALLAGNVAILDTVPELKADLELGTPTIVLADAARRLGLADLLLTGLPSVQDDVDAEAKRLGVPLPPFQQLDDREEAIALLQKRAPLLACIWSGSCDWSHEIGRASCRERV